MEMAYVQSAISRIQENFSLPVTGMLDLNTMKIMTKPRCDYPHKFNGTSTFTKQLSIKPWWGNEHKKNFRYAFGNNVPDYIKSLFYEVFNGWSNMNFIETTSFQDSDILIAFVQNDGKGEVLGSYDCISG
ncbi:hypothetical protein TSUD_239550 [Trifolium subterraneum]|uniref:Peptidoglycan binding-like domain-containing protein n=1 Tax=Trifolium subterraneum TaxID=3900 RepID=A0A2Z6PAY8_TRISU|nr:hypothetical protein TSUD_239550 [Trifolium subterraneum]